MTVFRFKCFSVDDHGCGMKVCSDSVLLAAWFAAAAHPVPNLIDVGTGSGVLSLLMADAWPEVHITALEIEPEAASAARHNFENSPWSNRLDVQSGDFRTYRPSEPVGAIICNPPYFDNGITAPDLSRAAARHQGSLSYESLMKYGAEVLRPEGVLGLVTPVQAEDSVIYAGTLAGFHPLRLCRVSTTSGKAPRRLLWLWSRKPGKMLEENICIRDASGYTREYLKLVEPFYLYL